MRHRSVSHEASFGTRSMPASQLASSSPLRYTARSIGVEAQIDGAESDYIRTGLPEGEDGSGQRIPKFVSTPLDL